MSREYKNIRPGLDIAVIGMAGRFPGARSCDELWNNLKNGVESISLFSDHELMEVGVPAGELGMPNYVRAKGVLADVEYFDAHFFGYSPAEAEKMDPQIRILHECTWHALEDAGYDPYAYKGAIGFYVGAQNNFYWQNRVLSTRVGGAAERFGLLNLADKDQISTRISYKFNFRGPCFTLVTQCSTSLVAVHQACQGLISGECDMALAGGISITLPQKKGHLYQEGMISSPDGHLRAFDSRTKGAVFGSGVGIVVFKGIEEAVADGDNIMAVIKSSFINNDGNRKVGYSAPSVEGQTEVIKSAIKLSEVEPESISYIETNGTATPLGDNIEIEALKLAFNTGKKHFCRIGTIKTNVGHLENASGVAGFIKTILVLKHRLIPPSLHFENSNPAIDFENSPFYVNTELTEWKSDKYPLRAGVSSFGIGGTNAHVVLEEWSIAQDPQRKAPGQEHRKQQVSREYHLIILSAKTGAVLRQMRENLANHLMKNPRLNLTNVAYILQVGRKVFEHRWMAVCSTVDEAIDALTSAAGGETHRCPLQGENFLLEKAKLTLDKHSLTEIGQSWLHGYHLDWRELYSQEQPYRISLPTYPFERQRYWIDTPYQGSPISPANTISKDGILTKEGIKALERILKVRLPHIAISKRDLLSIIDDFEPRPPSLPYGSPVNPEFESFTSLNELEEKLMETWKKHLGVKPKGIDDDFFHLGGDSLKAMILIGQIHKKFDVKISVSDFFNNPTIKSIVKIIFDKKKEFFLFVKMVETKEYYLLASAQKKVYFLQNMDPKGTAYNISLAYIVEGDAAPGRLENAFNQIIKRHESLRTSFHLINGEPVQKIHDKVEFKIECHIAERKSQNENRNEDRCMPYAACCASTIENFVRPFDLSHSPLLRVGWIRAGQERYILIFDIHHIVSDGTSMNLLAKEFMDLYNGKKLPELRIQYKDFCQWQNKLLQSGKLNQQEKYWQEELKGDIPKLDLPLDYPRPERQSFEGATVCFRIEEDITASLKQVANEENTTLYMVLLTLFKVLLAKICNQEEIVVGTPAAGRRHADLQPVMGMFLNILVLRSYPSGKKKLAEYLKQIKELTLAAFDNQDYPFEDLVNKLVTDRDISRNPLFNVMFIFQNMGTADIEIPGLKIKPYDYQKKTTMVDLTLIGEERDNRLFFRIEYCTTLWNKETIEKIIEIFSKIIHIASRDVNIKIKNLEVEDYNNNIQRNFFRQLTFDI